VIAGLGDWVAALPPLARLGLVAAAVVVVLGAGTYPLLAGLATLLIGRSRGWSDDVLTFTTLAVYVGTYIARCLYSPRAKCWWCHGKPKRFDSEGAFRNCWVCKGSGQRRRLGAKILARHRGE
jgi:hypothetical protein